MVLLTSLLLREPTGLQPICPEALRLTLPNITRKQRGNVFYTGTIRTMVLKGRGSENHLDELKPNNKQICDTKSLTSHTNQHLKGI
jgi:hypothetical protein